MQQILMKFVARRKKTATTLLIIWHEKNIPARTIKFEILMRAGEKKILATKF